MLFRSKQLEILKHNRKQLYTALARERLNIHTVYAKNFLSRDERLQETLRALSKKFNLICVTNNPVEPAQKTLVALGVENLIVSDFRRIMYGEDLLTFADFNREHRKCLDFVKSTVAASNAVHKIVVSHHVPSFRMQCPKFRDSKANGAFIVELEDFIKESDIEYWVYGHSHYNVDVRIGNTQCISNQLGYVFNNEQIGRAHV